MRPSFENIKNALYRTRALQTIPTCRKSDGVRNQPNEPVIRTFSYFTENYLVEQEIHRSLAHARIGGLSGYHEAEKLVEQPWMIVVVNRAIITEAQNKEKKL
jgi:hypothetical protein